ncbi:cysteine proteinase [Calocera viscosa TUFC12733]|uniref:Cysteine proteinase n=1 Tax=Calocera viscosa (strain TUFC12733) TaxID=1330018 RepID=A0A167G4Z2_CALVF|nr:cysteine proteinase [Calocera viscosa TUFC12733]
MLWKIAPADVQRLRSLFADARRLGKDTFRHCHKEPITGESFQRLLPNGWLNDEVVNSYIALVRAEIKKLPSAGSIQPSIHILGTFFYKKLVHPGYDNARLYTWTSKVDIFKLHRLIFPIHIHGLHWITACIDVAHKRIEIYDSLHESHSKVFKVIREYLVAEHRKKKGQDIDLGCWSDWTCASFPEQQTSDDCGVFAGACIRWLALGSKLVGDADSMRERMALEIADGKLATVPEVAQTAFRPSTLVDLRETPPQAQASLQALLSRLYEVRVQWQGGQRLAALQTGKETSDLRRALQGQVAYPSYGTTHTQSNLTPELPSTSATSRRDALVLNLAGIDIVMQQHLRRLLSSFESIQMEALKKENSSAMSNAISARGQARAIVGAVEGSDPISS